MGGNRVSVPRWYFNLFIVFLVSGFWHGADWTYVIWGALNGFYVIFGIFSKPVRDKINHFIGLDKMPRLMLFLQVTTTFTLICFSRIFFRSTSIHDALIVVKKVLIPNSPGFLMDPFLLGYCFAAIALLLVVEFHDEYLPGRFTLLYNKKALVRMLAVIGLLLIILLAGVYDGGQFIYFQF